MDCISKYNSIYVHGKTNSGKTRNVVQYLKDKNYEYQYCSIQNIKSESNFMDLLKNQNIFNMMEMKKPKRVIVIDNIDYLQNNDKKVLSIITKYMRKMNKIDEKHHQIKYIFIGINVHDKKVTELEAQVEYVYNVESQNTQTDVDKNIKEICKELFVNINMDYFKICEKSIVSLVFHENVIFYANQDLEFYYAFLKNFISGDFYDRISFQRQLWQFNDMTFFLKVINNYIKFHRKKWKNLDTLEMNHEIIFTKILTKYSNEYSNLNFLINICNRFNFQKTELIENLKNKKCHKSLLDNEIRRLNKLLL
tara:strand:- start:2855 stop:3778 length:924 start_codon:yes stop_codon:yes gene_type:complete